jgi:hypothetical protein
MIKETPTVRPKEHDVRRKTYAAATIRFARSWALAYHRARRLELPPPRVTPSRSADFSTPPPPLVLLLPSWFCPMRFGA